MHINSNILISKFNDIKYITFCNFLLTNLNKSMHTVVPFSCKFFTKNLELIEIEFKINLILTKIQLNVILFRKFLIFDGKYFNNRVTIEFVNNKS